MLARRLFKPTDRPELSDLSAQQIFHIGPAELSGAYTTHELNERIMALEEQGSKIIENATRPGETEERLIAVGRAISTLREAIYLLIGPPDILKFSAGPN